MADGAAAADDPFEGASSTRIRINNIPEKCNWSQIRKMFKGSTKIQSGKVDLKARDAWAECCDAVGAKALALSIAVDAFEGGAWVVELRDRSRFAPRLRRANRSNNSAPSNLEASASVLQPGLSVE